MKLHRMTVTLEFDSVEAMKLFRYQLDSLELAEGGKVIDVYSKEIYTHCVKCGVPRSHQTLGSGGMTKNPPSECRPAYAAACERRQMKNRERARIHDTGSQEISS